MKDLLLPEGKVLDSSIAGELKYLLFKKAKPLNIAVSPYAIDIEHAVKVESDIFTSDLIHHQQRLYFFSYHDNVWLTVSPEAVQAFFANSPMLDRNVFYLFDEELSWIILHTDEVLNLHPPYEYHIFLLYLTAGPPFLTSPILSDSHIPAGKPLSAKEKDALLLSVKKKWGFPKKYMAMWRMWDKKYEVNTYPLTDYSAVFNQLFDSPDKYYIIIEGNEVLVYSVSREEAFQYIDSSVFPMVHDVYVVDEGLGRSLALIGTSNIGTEPHIRVVRN